jgi:uncharacterized protein
VKDLVEYIARALVDKPDAVEVRQLADDAGDDTTVFELKVAPEDLGKIIGKQGRTARALRTLLAATSAKQNRRTVLEIVE